MLALAMSAAQQRVSLLNSWVRGRGSLTAAAVQAHIVCARPH